MSAQNEPAPPSNGEIETAAAQAKSHWTVHRTADGREYFYNMQTQKTTWEKPDELKTEFEVELSKAGWRQLSAGDGKKYYHNKLTGATSWELPPEFRGKAPESQEIEQSQPQQAMILSAAPTQ